MMTQPLFFPFRRGAQLAKERSPLGFWKRGPPLPDVRVDEEGITAPSLTLVGDQLDTAPRTLKWRALEGLRLERGPYGDSFFFAGPSDPDPKFILVELQLYRSDLVDPDGFQRAVESLSGRRFETIVDKPKPAEPGPSAQPAPPSAWNQTPAEDFAGGSSESRLFRVLTVWGDARATLLGLALAGGVFALLHFFAPAPISKAVTSAWFVIFVVGLGGMALGDIGPLQRLTRYHLVAAADGLYAKVPGRSFPRFTPWGELRDLTLTEGKVRSFHLASGGRHDAWPPTLVTLRTRAGSYSFECKDIESWPELIWIIHEHRAKESSQ